MPVEFLNSIIAISIGFSALASLITLFKSGDKFTVAEVLDFRGIIISSVLTSIGASIPFLVFYESDLRTTWIVTSIIYVIINSILQLQLEMQIRKGDYIVWTKLSPILRIANIIVTILVGINVFWYQSSLPILLALSWATLVIGLRLYIFLLSVTNAYSMPQIWKKDSNGGDQE